MKGIFELVNNQIKQFKVKHSANIQLKNAREKNQNHLNEGKKSSTIILHQAGILMGCTKPLVLLPLHSPLPQILDFVEVVEVAEAVDFADLVDFH